MNGPQDGTTWRAWRHVNDTFLDFGNDPQHVRLAISMDGVNPYN
jgi:hypothetical protein